MAPCRRPLAEDKKDAIGAAMRDFDKLTKAYAEAMESEGYKKAGSVGSIFFVGSATMAKNAYPPNTMIRRQ